MVELNYRPATSIIIRAYNEAAHIEKLLLGIKAQRFQPHEIILVDSGSTDDTVRIAEYHNVKIVHIAKADFTFGRALNYGCAAATGEILVFVSAHVYPSHDTWLEYLVAPFEDEHVTLSYGQQRGDRVNKFSEHQIFAKWFPNQPDYRQDGYFCNNANAAVRKSDWEKQPYDEALPGLEDLDWARKMQAVGGVIAYEPRARIIHVHDETWSQVRNRYRREAIAMRKIDRDVHFHFTDFCRLVAQHIFADSLRAAKQGRLLEEVVSIVRFRYNQMMGTWQGHRGPTELSRGLRDRLYFPTRDRDHWYEEDAVHDNHHQINYARLAQTQGQSSDVMPGRTANSKR